ncbi:MAG: hypothetical protein WCO68_05870 [Verrucomicrobiota bacterium]
MKTIEQQAEELEYQLRRAASLPHEEIVMPSPQFNKNAYNTFKDIVYPLVRTIRKIPPLNSCVVSFEGNFHKLVMMANIILEVEEPHVEVLGRVLATIFYKGGLRSHLAEYDPAVDPINFRLRKEVVVCGNEVKNSNVLEAWVAPGYDRRAATNQIALLREILSDTRNLISMVPPAFYPHVLKTIRSGIAA